MFLFRQEQVYQRASARKFSLLKTAARSCGSARPGRRRARHVSAMPDDISYGAARCFPDLLASWKLPLPGLEQMPRHGASRRRGFRQGQWRHYSATTLTGDRRRRGRKSGIRSPVLLRRNGSALRRSAEQLQRHGLRARVRSSSPAEPRMPPSSSCSMWPRAITPAASRSRRICRSSVLDSSSAKYRHHRSERRGPANLPRPPFTTSIPANRKSNHLHHAQRFFSQRRARAQPASISQRPYALEFWKKDVHSDTDVALLGMQYKLGPATMLGRSRKRSCGTTLWRPLLETDGRGWRARRCRLLWKAG